MFLFTYHYDNTEQITLQNSHLGLFKKAFGTSKLRRQRRWMSVCTTLLWLGGYKTVPATQPIKIAPYSGDGINNKPRPNCSETCGSWPPSHYLHFILGYLHLSLEKIKAQPLEIGYTWRSSAFHSPSKTTLKEGPAEGVFQFPEYSQGPGKEGRVFPYKRTQSEGLQKRQSPLRKDKEC